MADTFSKEERSAIMRKVKSNANKSTEQKLINIFKANGIKGWRRHYPVKGKPDFIFPKQKIAVFTDGCFWHGHHCRNITPKQNAKYWTNKRQRNIERDKKVNERLEQRGWTVLRCWECDIKRGTLDLTNLIGQPLKVHPFCGPTKPLHKSESAQSMCFSRRRRTQLSAKEKGVCYNSGLA